MAEQPTFAKAWLRQREAGYRQIVEIERAELRRLDPVRALQLSDALLAIAPPCEVTEPRRATSGFVEQQRLFGRAR